MARNVELDEDRDDASFEVDETFDVEEVEQARGGSGGAESVLLFLTGFAVAAGGLALAAAPNMSWHLSKIALKLESMGIHSGTFIMGGLVLLGLGMVTRSLAHAVHAASADPSLFAQLADDVTRTRASVGRLDRRVALVGKTVQTQGQSQSEALAALPSQSRAALETALAQSKGDEEQRGSKSDALWRLAASVDQLGARLDRGLEEQRKLMEAQLRQVWEELSSGTAAGGAAAPVEHAYEHERAHEHDGHEAWDAGATEAAGADGYDAYDDSESTFGGESYAHADASELDQAAPALPGATQQEGDVFDSLDEIEFLNDAKQSSGSEKPRAALPREQNQRPDGGDAVAQRTPREAREQVDFELLLPDDSIEAARRKKDTKG